jgi:putative inorganic carbon (hco3(-)) transporter
MTKHFLIRFLLFFQAITIIVSPLYILRFSLYIPLLNINLPSTLLEIFLLLSLVITFVTFIVLRSSIRMLKTNYDLYILLLVYSVVLSCYVTTDLRGGLGILKAYFIEPILFFYSLVYSSRLVPGFKENLIILSLVITGIWLSVLGVVQRLTGQFTLAPYELHLGRVSAVYNSANALALFLCPIIILLLVRLVVGKKLSKFIKLVLLLMLLIILYWTRSRGGMIALSGALLILLYVFILTKSFLLKKLWFILPAAFLTILVFFLASFYQTTNFVPYLYNRPYTNGDTLQIRYFIWTATSSLLKEHPIFGAGLNGFKNIYAHYKLPQYQENFQYPHNILLTFWVETGLLGLVSFLLIVVRSLRLLFKNIFDQKKGLYPIGLLGVFCYLTIHGMVDVPYFKNDLSLEFWVLVSLVEILNQKKQSAKELTELL